jgi:hypothetical protein
VSWTLGDHLGDHIRRALAFSVGREAARAGAPYATEADRLRYSLQRVAS